MAAATAVAADDRGKLGADMICQQASGKIVWSSEQLNVERPTVGGKARPKNACEK